MVGPTIYAYPPEVDRSAEATRRILKARNIYESTLRDLCVVQTRSAVDDPYGYPNSGYSDGAVTACLFIPTPAAESEGAQALTIDGEIRLPRAAVISSQSRIKVTSLYDSATGLPQVFEIVQGPIRTHIGYTMKVKLVTDGSGV